MKKSVYLICMAILGVSCTSDNYVPEENNVSDEEYVTMSFGYSGELVNVTTSSMTKVTKSGSSDDLFLFTLYEVNGENTNEHTYGYLVSDDPESCSMSFLKNRTYICQALCIPNGKTLIAKKPNGNYDYPFVEMGPYAGRSYKLNEPFYGDFAFDQGFLGFCMPSDLNEEIGNEIQWYDYYYNPVDIYYGAMFFNPEKNTNIVIDFYRMMFSVSLNITNFQSGKIRLLNKYEIHPSDMPFSQVIQLSSTPFEKIFNCSINDDLSEVIKNYNAETEFKIEYINSNGDTKSIFDRRMRIGRLINYDFSFDLFEVFSSNEMGFETNIINEDITETNSVPINY